MRVSDLTDMIATGPRGAAALHTVEDMRQKARRRLPRMVFDFVDGGADGEVTIGANRSAFDKVQFAPRFMVDVADRDQSTTLFGEKVDIPFLFAPAGLATLVHPEAELAAARAAARAGSVFALSTGSGYSIEDVAEASGGRLWFQLYLWKSDEVVRSLVSRARDAGYEALVLTVDVPVVGKRERDMRNGMSLPVRLRARSALDMTMRLPWLWRLLNGPEVTFASLTEIAPGDDATSIGEYTSRELTDQTRTWDDVAWLRREWDGPLLVKGVMTAGDAVAAVDQGADGVIVSNHGGRQLDGVPGTLDVLPSVVDAVGDRAEVLIDGGVRRGADVVRARALGAKAAMAGRPWFWALAAAGEEGVDRLMEIIAADIDRTLALIGVKAFDEVDEAVLA